MFEVAKEKAKPKPEPGRVYVKDKFRPFTEYKEFTRKGKNQGKIQVTLPDGKKVIVEKSSVKKWPGEAKKEVTLETFGFQTMYEVLAERLKQKKKEQGKLTKEDIKVFDTGEIVKQRKWNRTSESLGKKVPMQAPPIYQAELNIIKEMPELRPKPLGGWLENPIRTFEELGIDAKEMIYRPMKIGEHKVAFERKAIRDRMQKLRKGISGKSRRRIGAYAMSRQRRGKDILKSMGIEKIPNLTPKEMKVYNALRNEFDSLYRRLQKARRLSGKDPFPKVENYFTFFRDLNILDRMGFNSALTSADRITNQFIHLKTTPFRFAKARAKLGVMPVELDAFKIFSDYAEPAIKHIHLSPLIAKGRELLLTFGKGKARWKLSEKNPRTNKFLTEWLDFQAGQKPPSNLPPIVERALLKLNKNLTFAILGGNLRSAMIQVTALVQTSAEIGPYYTWKGINSLINPRMRNFAMEKSNVLLSRDYDVAVQDAMAAVRSGRIGEVKKGVGRAMLKPLQILDMETAKATWQGAYRLATERLNYTERKAINYADDVVTRTQASATPADIAPIQRTALGKALSLFQTFVINEWGFLTRDVLGIRNAKISNKTAFRKTMTLLAGTILANIFYEDILGINSPFPTPIREFEEALERGEDMPSASIEVAKELVEKVPILGGGLRYGKGMLGASVETIQAVAKGEKPIETGAKLIGIPGTVQVGKTLRAKKRGESTYGQIVGQYTPKKKRSKKKYVPKKSAMGGL
jgi:hypothetical protein